MRKCLGHPTLKTNIVPGEQRNHFSCSWLTGLSPALAQYTELFSPWATWPLGGTLSLCLRCMEMHLWCVHMFPLTGVCDLVAPEASWPMTVQDPHTGSRREPKMDSGQEKAKLFGHEFGFCGDQQPNFFFGYTTT